MGGLEGINVRGAVGNSCAFYPLNKSMITKAGKGSAWPKGQGNGLKLLEMETCLNALSMLGIHPCTIVLLLATVYAILIYIAKILSLPLPSLSHTHTHSVRDRYPNV